MGDEIETLTEDSTEGGVAATHPVIVTHPLLVGPTTESEFNTFRPALFPIACWRIEDLRFEFDSSFVKPEAAREMRKLAALRTEHQNAPLSVFGHADPVGNDVYNKKLSGRRARAIYALLTRDADIWEDLYSHAEGGDNWGVRAIQTMLEAVGSSPQGIDGTLGQKTRDALKDFQGKHGLKPDGNLTKDTRRELFLAYMEALCGADLKLSKADFLARGAHADGKGDYQGCSEFNPVLLFSKQEQQELSKPKNKNKRDSENAPNRRVVVFLFRPQTQVSPGKWPCPIWKQGVDGCKKRFWSDGEQRRTFQAERREYSKTKDTFACRFYDRIAGASPCETIIAPASKVKLWNWRWVPDKGVCGDKVKLQGETNLADGAVVKVSLKPRKGSSPNLESSLDLTVAGGKVEHEWPIKNVSFADGSSFLDKIEIEATPDDPTVQAAPAVLTVEALLDAPEDTFDEKRKWGATGQFTNHSRFKQKLVKFRNQVTASFDIMKMWGGYWVDLSGFGITGTVEGGPGGSGRRWARATGLNAQLPNQYHDGSNWVAMPAGFTYSHPYNAIGFYKKGSKFVPKGDGGGEWPGSFADYDFNSPTHVARRNIWIQKTHELWTDQFHIRRKNCPSEEKTRCCRYELEVTLSFRVVTADGPEVIAVCPGGLRSNAKNWFMGDTRDELGAHETGHHLDCPDEYAGGAVDTSLNIPGEVVNGVDQTGTSLMNGGKQVKKRHYHAFVEMNKRLVKKKYGRDYNYETVDK